MDILKEGNKMISVIYFVLFLILLFICFIVLLKSLDILYLKSFFKRLFCLDFQNLYIEWDDVKEDLKKIKYLR